MADQTKNEPVHPASAGVVNEELERETVNSLNEERSDALDKLFKEATGDGSGEESGDPKAAGESIDEPDSPIADPVEDPESTEEEPEDTQDDPESPEKVEETEETPETPKQETDFNKVELPSYSKPKTAEAFATVKTLANQRLEELQKQLEEAQANSSELQGALEKRPEVDPKVHSELEELRKFRRSIELEHDPEFKAKYDGKINSNFQTVYESFKEEGHLNAEQIKKIEELGVSNVDWYPLVKALPDGELKRYLDGKLSEITDLNFSRKQELRQLKQDPEAVGRELVESRSKELVEATNGYLKRLPWAKEVEIPASASEAEKKELAQNNQIARKTNEIIKESLKHYGPEMFAQLAIGTAVSHKLDIELKAVKKASEEAITGLEKQVSELTKDRDAIKAKLEKIQKAAKTRSSRQPSAAKPIDTSEMTTEEALDALKSSVGA